MILLGGKITVHAGDCLDVIRTLADNSVDSVVTDPPYNLGFMGRAWDRGSIAFTPEFWREVLRVLKPGGHLLAFSGTRTYHRMACAIEDAGFEIRDTVMWCYGSGFPKSHDVSKGIDKAAGFERGTNPDFRNGPNTNNETKGDKYSLGYAGQAVIDGGPITPEAQQWQGWGTALKPAVEPVLYGAKPLTAAQVFGIVIGEISPRLIQCLNLNASDAGALSSAIQAKLHAVGAHTVLEPAKMRVLASIEAASFAELGSICPQLGLGGSSRTQESSAHTNVRENGSQKPIPERTTPSGKAVDISTLTADIITSLLEGENTSESIASLWSDFSAAALDQTNRFTTSTAIRSITDLRTLRSLLHPSTSNGIGNLSPNASPICLARKPLSEGTVAANVLRWGTGAINIDASRVQTSEALDRVSGSYDGTGFNMAAGNVTQAHALGRWPANLIHDGSDEVLAAFPETGAASAGMRGEMNSGRHGGHADIGGNIKAGTNGLRGHDDDGGSAARFFYSAKADSDDRLGSRHPTVKPLDLMQYLVRLVTPKTTFALVCRTCDKPGYAAQTTADEDMRAMSRDIPAEPGREALTEVLRDSVLEKSHGIEARKTKGENGSRLFPGMEAGQPDGEQTRLCHGAPAGDGGASGTPVAQERSSSSPERQTNGQSDRELGADAQERARPSFEAEAVAELNVSALQGGDKSSSRVVPAAHEKNCPNCGSPLERIKRPGVVLDCFAGTGTTGEAAFREGCRAILIEREPEYLADIERRCSLILAGPVSRSHATIKAKGKPEDAGPLFEVRP